MSPPALARGGELAPFAEARPRRAAGRDSAGHARAASPRPRSPRWPSQDRSSRRAGAAVAIHRRAALHAVAAKQRAGCGEQLRVGREAWARASQGPAPQPAHGLCYAGPGETPCCSSNYEEAPGCGSGRSIIPAPVGANGRRHVLSPVDRRSRHSSASRASVHRPAVSKADLTAVEHTPL